MQLRCAGAGLLLALWMQAAFSSDIEGTASLSEIYKYGDDPEGNRNHTGTHWTYDLAGDDWAGADAAGNPWICLTGKQQSPVNLPLSSSTAKAIDPEHKAAFQLGTVTSNGSNVGVANTGHSVQIFWQDPSFAPAITIMVQAGQPLLSNIELQRGQQVVAVKAVPRQFHFHTQSEHLMSGHMYPLEAHLVSVIAHRDLPSCPATGCIVVTGIIFELADDMAQDNPWLAPLFDIMPYKEGAVSYLPAGKELNLQQLLPANASYMTYSGSLTTPPCTEGVLWMIMVNAQKVSLQQWRSFMKAVGDYNCTLLPDNATNSSSLGGNPANSSRIGLANDTSGSNSDSAVAGGPRPSTAANSSSSNNSSTAHRHLQQVGRVSPLGLHRRLAETPAGQHYVCDKLGAGANYRLPQDLNGRTVRIWREVSTKKSYLPEDAATAASAGAIAGIVLGTTLGAGLTVAFGYLAYNLYKKRRLKRLYNAGVSDNDMMMVQREVESQWLTGGLNNSSSSQPVARHSRSSIQL